jgi:hypothetical protein
VPIVAFTHAGVPPTGVLIPDSLAFARQFREVDSEAFWLHGHNDKRMCRNIKPLFNFDPPVTDDEIRAASLQFVRKISGFTKPSKSNETAFLAAIDDIAAASSRLLDSLETSTPAKSREEHAEKMKARAARRFGRTA